MIAIFPVSMSPPSLPSYPKRQLRQLIMHALRTDAELDALCCDYFQSVYARFSSGMDRQHKLTLLISTVAPGDLLRALRQVAADVVANFEAAFSPSDAAQPALGLEEDLDREREQLIKAGQPTAAIDRQLRERQRAQREGQVLREEDVLADRFVLHEVLDSRGLSEVWRAYDRERKQRVALKILRGKYRRDRSQCERFKNGYRILDELRHPGILRTLAPPCEDRGVLFYVVEFRDGGSLAQAIAGGGLSPGVAQALILEAAEAIDAAHQQGYVHGDLNPQKILLGRGPVGRAQTVVTGFDLAVRVTSPEEDPSQSLFSHSGFVSSNRLYAAPERFRGLGIAEPRSDLLSLALIFAAALHGQEPSDTDEEPFERERYVSELSAPEALKQVLLRAVSFKPSARQRSVAELREAILHSERAPTRVFLANRHGGDSSPQAQRARADELVEQGKLKEAEALLRFALASQEQAVGDDGPDLVLLTDRLASLLSGQGRYREAELQYRRSLAIDEKSLGPAYINVGTDLFNIAATLEQQDNLEESILYYQRSLRIYQKEFPPESEDTLNCLDNLARLLDLQDQAEEAIDYYEQSLAVREKIFGRMHRELLSTLQAMSGIRHRQELWLEAEQLDRRLLAVCEISFGSMHPDTAEALNGLALTLQHQGLYAEAERHYRRSLAIRQARLGPDDPDVGYSLFNLGTLLCEAGQPAAAESQLLASVAILASALGDEHDDVEAVRSWLSRARQEQAGPDEGTLSLPPQGRGGAREPVSGEVVAARAGGRLIRYAAKRDTGRAVASRQDAYAIYEEMPLFLVAAGGSETRLGQPVAKMAIETIVDFFTHTEDEDAPWPFRLDRNLSYAENRLVCACRLANQKVCELAGVGSVVGCLLSGERLITAWVGHCRAYRLRQGRLQRLTRDHTFAEWLRDSVPTLSDAQLSGVPNAQQLRRALGLSDAVVVDVRTDELLAGDRILLCSAGLTRTVPDELIVHALLRAGADLEVAVSELVDVANPRGGQDDLSALLIEVGEE